MRELDPHSSPQKPACAVVGAGRLGTVLAAALPAIGPLRRGEPVPPDAEVVLLCSDGLSDSLDDGAIAGLLTSLPDREECADRLVAAALAAGARDNVSVIVADVAAVPA